MSLELHVWDTDAVIEAMKNARMKQRFTQDFILGTIAITAASVLELAVWSAEDPDVARFYDGMHRSGNVLIPKKRDFYRAGRWLRSLRTAGTAEERRYQRLKLTMDSLTAATAWGAGMVVVTKNRRDFDRLAAEARGMLPAGHPEPKHIRPTR